MRVRLLEMADAMDMFCQGLVCIHSSPQELIGSNSGVVNPLARCRLPFRSRWPGSMHRDATREQRYRAALHANQSSANAVPISNDPSPGREPRERSLKLSLMVVIYPLWTAWPATRASWMPPEARRIIWEGHPASRRERQQDVAQRRPPCRR